MTNDDSIAATLAPTQMPGASADRGGDAELAPGTTIGEYVVDGLLGEGGFGVVYRATHPLIGKQVAIKILNRAFSADPGMVSRFIAEARAVNQIRHRNIIDIFSFGQLPDLRQYYVMELLAGAPFDSYLERHGGRLSPEEALPLLRAVARALDAAHANGIAHRDLKPENVFISDDDGTPFPKLLDFGIAKLMSDGPSQHKTRTGAPMGTPTYMSPEQCRGRHVDHRTDIYSFGIMTYRVLAGILPFRGEDFVDLLLQQTQETPEAPSRACPDLPVELDAPILHMMEKDPAKRPLGVTAAVDALYVAIGMPVPAQGSRTQDGRDAPSLPRAPTRQGSLIAAEAFSPAPRGRRTRLVGACATAAAIAAVAIALVVSRSSGDTAAVTAAAPPPPPPTSPAPSVEPPPSPVARPPAEPPPRATPATVEITIKGAPVGTQVYGDGHVLLATLPGALVVPRGDVPLAITLERAGFTPRTERIAVAAPASLELALQPVAAPAAPKPAAKRVATPVKTGAEIPDFDEGGR